MYQPTSFGLARRIFAVSLILALFTLLITAQFAQAAPGINDQIPFDGSLKDSAGDAVADGTYDMVFRLYDAAAAGTTLWTGTHTAGNGNDVTVADGIFRVMLGSGAGNSLTGVDFNDDTIYVGISVEADPEMTPRYQLGAAAYAFNSDTLDGLDSTDFISTSTSQAVNFSNGIGIASSTPGATSSTLYNLGSVLYWNGSALGSGGATTLNALTDVNAAAVNGSLFYYNGTTWDDIATSSLAINTDDLIEGSALFWTDARFASALAGTTTDAVSEGSSNLYFTTDRASTTALAVLAATTTDALAEGGANLYWTDARFDTRLSATTTLPGLTILSGLTTVGQSGATTTVAGNLEVDEGIHLTSNTPSNTSNALYNNAGTLYWNGTDISTPPAGTITTSNAATSFTAVVNTSYQVDTTVSEITVTLPTGGVDGDVVRIEDAAGNFAANNTLVLPGGGDTIEGSTGTTTLSTSNTVTTFIYDADNSRWTIQGDNEEASTQLHRVYLYERGADRNTSIQSVTTGSTQDWDTLGGVINFTSADAVVNNGVTIGTNQITIAQAGTYRLDLIVSIDSSGASDGLISQITDGSTVLSAAQEVTNSSASEVTLATHYTKQFAAGDTLDFRLQGSVASVGLKSFEISVEQLPTAVITAQAQAVEYLLAEAGADQTITSAAAGTPLEIDTTVSVSGSSVTNAGTGRYSLTAGKTYRLTSSLSFGGDGGEYDEQFQWFDVTGAVFIGTQANVQDFAGDSAQHSNHATAIFSPVVDSDVEIRFVSAGDVNLDTLRQESSLLIETIADGTFVQELGGATDSTAGTAGFLSGAAAGEQGSLLLGDGNWSATSTLFINASGTMALGAHEEITGGNSSNIADNSLVLGNGALCVDGGGLNCDDSVRAAGTIYADASSLAGVDLAENYPSNDSTLLPGELVVIDSAAPSHIKRSEDTSEMLLGVISTKPGVLLGGYGDKEFEGAHRAAVALAGRVPVLFSAENGPVEPGDKLIMSVDKPGYSMAACGPIFCGEARSIGIALESFSEDMDGDTELVAAELVEEAEAIEEAIEEAEAATEQLEAIEEAIDDEITEIVTEGGSLEELSELSAAAEEVEEDLEEAEAIEEEMVALEEVVDTITEEITNATGEGRLMVFVELGETSPTAAEARAAAGRTLDDGVLEYLGSVIGNGADAVREFVKSRVVAVTGFFDTLFAREIHTESLCIGDTCLSESELEALLEDNDIEPVEIIVPVVIEPEAPEETLEENEIVAEEEVIDEEVEVVEEDVEVAEVVTEESAVEEEVPEVQEESIEVEVEAEEEVEEVEEESSPEVEEIAVDESAE